MAGISGRDPPRQRHLLLLARSVPAGLVTSSGIFYRWRSSRRFRRLRVGLRSDPAGRPRAPRFGVEATPKSCSRFSRVRFERSGLFLPWTRWAARSAASGTADTHESVFPLSE